MIRPPLESRYKRNSTQSSATRDCRSGAAFTRESGFVLILGIFLTLLLLALAALVIDTLLITRVSRGLQRQADAMALAMASQLKPLLPTDPAPNPTSDDFFLDRLESYLRAKRAAPVASRENAVFGDAGASFYVGSAYSTPVRFPLGWCASYTGMTHPCFEGFAKDPYDSQYEGVCNPPFDKDAVEKRFENSYWDPHPGGAYIASNLLPYSYREYNVTAAHPDSLGSNNLNIVLERGYYDRATGKFYSLEGSVCASADGQVIFPDPQGVLDANGGTTAGAYNNYSAYYRDILQRSQVCQGTGVQPGAVPATYEPSTAPAPWGLTATAGVTKLYLQNYAICCDDVQDNAAIGGCQPPARCAGNRTRACPPDGDLGPFASADRYSFEVANAARVTLRLERVPTLLPNFLGSTSTGSLTATAVSAPDSVS